MLDKKDLEAIGGMLREEFHGDALRGVIREVIHEEFKGETLRVVIREEIGSALEQIVLPRFGILEERMDGLDARMDGLDGRMDGLDARMDGLDGRMDGLDGRMSRIESTMVTKDFLEDRLADFKATLKESGGQALRQIKCLATEIHRNGGLTAKQVVQVTSA